MREKAINRYTLTIASLLVAGCGADANLASSHSPGAGAEIPSESAEPGGRQSATQETSSRTAQQQALDEIVGAEMAQRLLAPMPQAPVCGISLVTGTSVSWHELSYGSVLVVEVGPPSARQLNPETVNSLSAAQLYQSLSGTNDVPPALQALDARRLEMAPIYDAIRAMRSQYPALTNYENELTPVSHTPVPSKTQSAARSAGEAFGEVTAAVTVYDFGLTPRDSIATCSASCSETSSTVNRYRRTKQLETESFSSNDVYLISGKTCAINRTIGLKLEARPWWTWSTVLNVQVPEGQMEDYIAFNLGIDVDFRHTWIVPSGGRAAGCAIIDD